MGNGLSKTEPLKTVVLLLFMVLQVSSQDGLSRVVLLHELWARVMHRTVPS